MLPVKKLGMVEVRSCEMWELLICSGHVEVGNGWEGRGVSMEMEVAGMDSLELGCGKGGKSGV